MLELKTMLLHVNEVANKIMFFVFFNQTSVVLEIY